MRPADNKDEARWNLPLWSKLVRDGKVVQGKGGWLFLANDSSDVLRQHSGERTLSPAEIDGWRVLLEERTERLARMGATYVFLVAPDTHSVYPEKLPDDMELAVERPIHKLLDRLEETDSPARVIYPLAELMAKKEERQVCSAYDTHWSEFGAFVAYTRLMDEVKKNVPVRQLLPGHMLYYTRMMPGELSVKLGFDEDVEQLATQLYTRARLLEDNCVFNRGSYAVLECDQAPPTKCVMFGDSYSLMLLRFLSESFRRLVFAHMPTLDYELIEREQPDVVISLLAERFLIEVPDDSKGETFAEHARSKLERGLTRGRLPMWDRRPEPRVDLVAIETVEKIRANLLSAGRARDAVFVSLIAYGGMFPQIAQRLRWEDFSNGAVRVHPLEGDGEPRLVHLIEPLAEEVEQWKQACGGTDAGPLFENEGWDDWPEAVFVPAAAAAGTNGLGLQELRHCLATVLVRAGAGWEEIGTQTGMRPQQALGRNGHLIDEVYAHGPVSPSEQVRAAREAAGGVSVETARRP